MGFSLYLASNVGMTPKGPTGVHCPARPNTCLPFPTTTSPFLNPSMWLKEKFSQVVVAHAFNPSTREAESCESL